MEFLYHVIKFPQISIKYMITNELIPTTFINRMYNRKNIVGTNWKVCLLSRISNCKMGWWINVDINRTYSKLVQWQNITELFFVIQRNNRRYKSRLNIWGKKINISQTKWHREAGVHSFSLCTVHLRMWAIMANHNILSFVALNNFCISIIYPKLCSFTTKYRRCFALTH